mgnify:CR=1 FL=1
MTSPPQSSRKRKGASTASLRGRKGADYAQQDERNRKLGLAGEELVSEHEKAYLQENGRDDLAGKVRHIAVTEGDGAGYDVQSWTLEEQVKYIEVKTTRGGRGSAFYLSSNEFNFSQQHPDNYNLYRMYGYEEKTSHGKYYFIAGVVAGGF